MAMNSNSAWAIADMEVDGPNVRATVVCQVEPRGEQEGGSVSIAIQFASAREPVSKEELYAEVIERAREIARRSQFVV